MDTTGFVTDIAGTVSAIGYNTFQDGNRTADASMGYYFAESDAVWAMYGHGGPGYITQHDPNYGNTVLNASYQIPGSSCSFPNDCITDHSWSQLHGVRLMVFWACETGASNNGVNMLTEVANRGVDSAIAWTATIYTDTGRSWNWMFFYRLRYGWTVSDAAYSALVYVLANYGYANGMDSYQIGGSGGTTIAPAQYGS